MDTIAGAASSRDLTDQFDWVSSVGLRASGYNSPAAIVSVGPGLDIVADAENNVLRRLFADQSNRLFHTSSSALGLPSGLALAPDGTIYIADSANHVIRRFDPTTGILSTFAGLAGAPGSLDATGIAARFSEPTELAIDSEDRLLVLESSARRLRRITPEGVVVTLHTDTARVLDQPRGLAIDSRGRIYLTDRSHRVFILPPGGGIGVLGGTAGSPGAEDHWNETINLFDYPADASRFDSPGAVTVGRDDTLYIADTGNSTIRRARTKLDYLLREPVERSITPWPDDAYDQLITSFPASVAHSIEIISGAPGF